MKKALIVLLCGMGLLVPQQEVRGFFGPLCLFGGSFYLMMRASRKAYEHSIKVKNARIAAWKKASHGEAVDMAKSCRRKAEQLYKKLTDLYEKEGITPQEEHNSSLCLYGECSLISEFIEQLTIPIRQIEKRKRDLNYSTDNLTSEGRDFYLDQYEKLYGQLKEIKGRFKKLKDDLCEIGSLDTCDCCGEISYFE